MSPSDCPDMGTHIQQLHECFNLRWIQRVECPRQRKVGADNRSWLDPQWFSHVSTLRVYCSASARPQIDQSRIRRSWTHPGSGDTSDVGRLCALRPWRPGCGSGTHGLDGGHQATMWCLDPGVDTRSDPSRAGSGTGPAARRQMARRYSVLTVRIATSVPK